jgi:hypothetical protein
MRQTLRINSKHKRMHVLAGAQTSCKAKNVICKSRSGAGSSGVP